MLLAAVLPGCASQEEMASANSALEAEVASPGTDEPRIIPIPPIPAALHGCWEMAPSDDPDEPHPGMRVVIDSRTVVRKWDDSVDVATADYVNSLTATSIEGRFATPRDGSDRTVATALILGPDSLLGLPAGMLRIAEGDAGSWGLSRCEAGE